VLTTRRYCYTLPPWNSLPSASSILINA
jgi:hypothetical protein